MRPLLQKRANLSVSIFLEHPVRVKFTLFCFPIYTIYSSSLADFWENVTPISSKVHFGVNFTLFCYFVAFKYTHIRSKVHLVVNFTLFFCFLIFAHTKVHLGVNFTLSCYFVAFKYTHIRSKVHLGVNFTQFFAFNFTHIPRFI